MAKKATPAKKRSTVAKSVDVRHLSQTDAAALLGRSASWLRERPAVFERDANGFYDGRQIVRAIRRDYEAAQFTGPDLHHAITFGEILAGSVDCLRPGAIDTLRAVKDEHGAAGLAALALILLSELERAEQAFPSLDPAGARGEFRSFSECESCGRIRWAGIWQDVKRPAGYKCYSQLCPDCSNPTKSLPPSSAVEI